ncbi:DNA primase family protein [Staphylococcus equorum]|uniref:DNA primase family protein n=1 Tax=Staphylococcus equorum TaxID=246432 RepID=UPI002DBCCF7A|nr:phage/plasmid primase, P4 family [Staphylococcus equorum]MEB7675187.1 phage/plasmid primase, P4 family [Staphylococcus equorum]
MTGIPNYIVDNKQFDPDEFFDGNKFLHYKFASFLYNKHNGCLLEGTPHIYTGKRYESLDIDRIRVLTLKYIPYLRENQNKELLFKLKAMCLNNPKEQSPPNYIGVSNGIYNVLTDELLDFSPDFYITNIINAKYDPNAKSSIIEKFIEDIADDDKEVIHLLYEIIGYGLYRENILQVAFFFYSPGGNGKTTLFRLLHKFFNEENTSALSFNDLNHRFKPASLQSKLVNIADDIDPTYIKETANFKIIVTGNFLSVERKGQDDYEFKPYVKLYFAGNELPTSSDKSHGFYRRMVIIPMLRTFGKDGQKKDPLLVHKLITEENMSALLNLAIKGLKDVLKRGEIIEPQITKETKKEYEVLNDPILQFINDASLDDYRQIPVVEGRPTNKAYEIYRIWCENNGFKFMSKPRFSRELSRLNYEMVVKWSKANKKSVRFYSKNNTKCFYDYDGNLL